MALPYAATPSQLQQVKQDLEKAEARLEEKIEAVEEVAEDSIPAAEKGVPDGVATLDGAGKVPASQLPSYVDDVEEYATLSEFPAEGETGKIYVAIDTGFSYRWGGSTYVQMSSGLELGETATTAYAGDKGKANADAITIIQQTLEGGVVHPETGKGLSTNDFTDADQTKLSGIATQATKAVANPALTGNESILDGVEVNGTKFGLLKDNYVIYDSKDHSGEVSNYRINIDRDDILTWANTQLSIANYNEYTEYDPPYLNGKVNLDTHNFINKLKVVVTITPVIDDVRDETKTFVRQFKFEAAYTEPTSEDAFDYNVRISFPQIGSLKRKVRELYGNIWIETDPESGDSNVWHGETFVYDESLPGNYSFDIDRIIWLHPNSIDGELLYSSRIRHYPTDEGDYNISVDQSGNAFYKQISGGGNTDIIAETYDASKTYHENDIVLYNNKLYRCKTNSVTGEWNANKWIETEVSKELPRTFDYLDLSRLSSDFFILVNEQGDGGSSFKWVNVADNLVLPLNNLCVKRDSSAINCKLIIKQENEEYINEFIKQLISYEFTTGSDLKFENAICPKLISIKFDKPISYYEYDDVAQTEIVKSMSDFMHITVGSYITSTVEIDVNILGHLYVYQAPVNDISSAEDYQPDTRYYVDTSSFALNLSEDIELNLESPSGYDGFNVLSSDIKICAPTVVSGDTNQTSINYTSIAYNYTLKQYLQEFLEIILRNSKFDATC